MASKSGNPAKAAEQRRISQVGDFKKRLGGITELPSGLVVKLKNPGGLRAFLGTDTIPNGLMGIVQEAMDKGKGVEMEALMPDGKLDPQMLKDMMSMMDNVAMTCIKDPKFLPIPENEDDRSDEILYIDELPDDDKQFIFAWVSGGTTDLATFRAEHERGLAAVVDHTSAGSDS